MVKRLDRLRINFAHIKAQSHIRDARSARRNMKNLTSASLCIQLLSEFVTHAQRVASALGVYSVHGERKQSA